MTPTPLDVCPRITLVKQLDSGYWYVKFGPEIFVQWPIGQYAQPSDVFHGGDDAEWYARTASRKVGVVVSD